MKIKHLPIVVLLLSFVNSFAQIPTGYYDGTSGLTGATLKTKLSEIIKAGHIDKGYAGLWTAYKTTDIDKDYENDGTILDIYSENPTGTDPYKFTVSTSQCGGYSVEGDCYNREHIIPQSLFDLDNNGDGDPPMVSDIHFIRATDGKVNGMRSNYPFGEVGSATFTSKNGSKLGSSISSNYSGTVFEPIDEFKGDVARMIFYFITRYETRLSTFKSGNILGNTAFPGLTDWELAVLISWHTEDPVSQTEINRNNASYTFQGNRNPYIDHPEYVSLIWGDPVPDTEAPTTPTNLALGTITSNSIALSWTASTDNVAVSGYEIYIDGTLKTTVTGTSATISGLASSTAYSFYVIAKDSAGNKSSSSNSVNGSTLAPDTQAPTTPTNLTLGTITSNSIALSWTASTDNIAVSGYEIYIDNVLKTTVTGTSATISGLVASTAYSFYIIAKDSAGNKSTSSNTITGTTNAASTGATCGTEDFESIPASSSSYSTRTWTANSIQWTATDARTDQKITNKAILVQNGSLTSSTISGGIGNLTVSTKQFFSGSAGSFNLLINGTKVATIPYTSSPNSNGGTITTTTIPDINITGNITISLVNNSTSTRVAIDDLSWTCYNNLATNEVSKPSFYISPNPVKNNILYVHGKNLEKISRAEIYNTNGVLVQVMEKPFNNKNSIQLRNLTKGLYFLKFENNSYKFIVE